MPLEFARPLVEGVRARLRRTLEELHAAAAEEPELEAEAVAEAAAAPAMKGPAMLQAAMSLGSKARHIAEAAKHNAGHMAASAIHNAKVPRAAHPWLGV